MNSETRYQKGDKIGRRYLVYQALKGGMGEVYLCVNEQTGEPFALKTFQQKYAGLTNVRERFKTEVRAWVGLKKHPHIVRCFYMDTTDNIPFLFLEWVASEEGHGTELRSWMCGSIEPRWVLQWVIEITRGLEHAQQVQPGIVHRDLKPENVLIGQRRIARITDWGLAKLVQDTQVMSSGVVGESASDLQGLTLVSGGIVGTPLYMAPEQWRGEALDFRTDLYALGCMLYEMLSGRPPFRPVLPRSGFTRDQILASLRDEHLSAAVPALAAVGMKAETHARMEAILARLLAKDASARYEAIDALLLDLEAVYRLEMGQSAPVAVASEEFTPQDYINRGITYARIQQYDRALSDLTEVLRLDPDNEVAYYNRGNTYAVVQQYDRALSDLTEAIRLDPAYTLAFGSRANTYAELRQYDRALSDYTEAIRLNPGFAIAYCNRGLTYSDLKQYDRALSDYHEAIRLDPGYHDAYCNRGNAYADLQQYDRAFADYAEAIRLDPGSARAYFNRGTAYRNLQQYDRALSDYHEAIRLVPTYAKAHFDIGALLANTGQLRESLPFFERAAELGHLKAADAVQQLSAMIRGCQSA